MKFFKARKNEGISSLRDKLGLTQDELAEILMINRSSLAMNEQRRRPLPGNAILKIALLEITLVKSNKHQGRSTAAHPSERNMDTLINEMAAQSLLKESTCMVRAEKLKTQLASILIMYKRTRHWLELIEEAIAQEKFTLPDEQAWWERQKQMALSKLYTCDKTVQTHLQHKINLLLGEARLHREALQLTVG